MSKDFLSRDSFSSLGFCPKSMKVFRYVRVTVKWNQIAPLNPICCFLLFHWHKQRLPRCMAIEIFEVVSQLVVIFSTFFVNFAGAMNGGGYGWERARARPQKRNSLALKTILWWQPRNGDHSHENNSTGLGKGVISGKNQTIDGATNTSASNHAPKISATLYEKPLEHQEVAIVGKRWRLNQPLQNSCGAIRNTHSASITNNHSGLSLFTKFWEEKIEKNSVKC